MLGSHCIKTWSKTQALTALSSGESEFYGCLKAAAEGLGLLSIMRDLGYSCRGQVYGDASAALGITNRKGLGRTRHIDTGLLWIQETAAEKRLSFDKVLGLVNPADLLTKYLTREVMMSHCRRISAEFTEGRAEVAPELNNILKAMFGYDFDGGEIPIQDDQEILLCTIQAKIEDIRYKKYKRCLINAAMGEQQSNLMHRSREKDDCPTELATVEAV